MPDYKRDESEIGVLWEKESARGTYFTGTIEIDGTKHPIVVFKNGNKRSEKAPDWRILKSVKRDQAPAVATAGAAFDDPPF